MEEKRADNPERIIETTFLIPIREGESVGNGELHSELRWQKLIEILYVEFGGWTIEPDLYPGGWVNPDTGLRVEDESRKYFVDIKEKELNKMREIIRWIAREFKQQCIRFEHAGEVEYISSEGE